MPERKHTRRFNSKTSPHCSDATENGQNTTFELDIERYSRMDE